MSLGQLVSSAHQISTRLAEMYEKDILEGPPRLAVNAPCLLFNFPTIHSFNIEPSVGFVVGFSSHWLCWAESYTFSVQFSEKRGLITHPQGLLSLGRVWEML